MKNKTLPVFLTFLCMGFGDAVGPFVSLAKDTFELSNFISGFIAFAGFIMFGILSIPMGIFQDKKGKKFVLMLGLIIALAGLSIPVVSKLSSFNIFLITVLLLGAGAATLQVAGNPIMRDVSPEGKYARNLTLGQFIKAIGSLSGPLLPVIAIIWFKKDWQIIFPVYVSALIITIAILGFTKIKERKDRDSFTATFKSCFSLLSNRYVLMMVMAIFLYVGSEICMSSYLPEYLKSSFGLGIEEVLSKIGFNIETLKLAGINTNTLGVLGTGFFFIGLLAGRFSGSLVLNWMSAKVFLIITSLLSVAGLLGLFVINTEVVAFICIIITGFGFGNIFPLVFSITIEKMPQRTNELSGLMITAIAGGAIIPLLFGAIADKYSVLTGFLVPVICLLYITFVSIINTRKY
ncbi:MAG: MFS transporter [Bacteroidales bacterium]|nr:MAG: MFS transporter [Bacteroidales bacterium]